MSTLNNTSFNAIADKLNIVLNAFHNGKSIVVFTFKHTILLSNKLHSEAVLMSYLNGSVKVRIC